MTLWSQLQVTRYIATNPHLHSSSFTYFVNFSNLHLFRWVHSTCKGMSFVPKSPLLKFSQTNVSRLSLQNVWKSSSKFTRLSKSRLFHPEAFAIDHKLIVIYLFVTDKNCSKQSPHKRKEIDREEMDLSDSIELTSDDDGDGSSHPVEEMVKTTKHAKKSKQTNFLSAFHFHTHHDHYNCRVPDFETQTRSRKKGCQGQIAWLGWSTSSSLFWRGNQIPGNSW